MNEAQQLYSFHFLEEERTMKERFIFPPNITQTILSILACIINAPCK